MCARTRSFCAKQGYGIQPRPAKGKRSVLLSLYTVQFSWRTSPRRVCVLLRHLSVCSWGRCGGFVWTEWTLISRLISPKGSVGEKCVCQGGRRGTGLHRSPSCLVDGNRSGIMPPRARARTHTQQSLAGVLRCDFVLQYVIFLSCTQSCRSLCIAGEYPLRTEGPRNAT